MLGQCFVYWWLQNSERGSQQSSPPVESFPRFLSTCYKIWTWNLVYTFSTWHDTSSLSCIAIRSPWPTLQLEIGHYFYTWPSQLDESSKFGIYTYKTSILAPIEFCYSLDMFGPRGLKHSEGGIFGYITLVPVSREFSRFFSKCFEASTSKLLHKLSRLYNILSTHVTKTGSLWPNTCSWPSAVN